LIINELQNLFSGSVKVKKGTITSFLTSKKPPLPLQRRGITKTTTVAKQLHI
jgi:hypothetical protein